jgi:hypothetical protein
MLTYSIELIIDSQDLHAIKAAQQQIVLAKPVNDTCLPNVAWQSFDPGSDNVVTWSEEYGVYASNTNLVHGARILKTSSMPYPAQDGAYYSFATDATFYGPFQSSDAPAPGQYGVSNEVPSAHYPALVFGLVQNAIINDTAFNFRPLNAQLVGAKQRATFTPLCSVYIWLQSTLSSGTVITRAPRKVALVTFDQRINAQTLKYDSARGIFVPYSLGNNAYVHHAPHTELLKRAFI